jgi:membrane protein DedA with SNARE-associated domain
MYGFRHIVPFSLGMTTFPVKKFVFFNSLGAILWVTVFGSLGFLFGDILEVAFGHIKRYELSLIVLVVFIFIGFSIISRLVKWLLAEKI